MWEFADFSDEDLNLFEDCGVFKVGERVDEFVASFAIDKEESVFDAADCGSCAVSNVIVEDVTKVVWSLNRGFVGFLFGK